MLPDPREKPLLTVADVAALMPDGVGEKAVRAAIADGQLPSLRVGRYVLVPTAALLRVLDLHDAPDSSEDRPAQPALALAHPPAAKTLGVPAA